MYSGAIVLFCSSFRQLWLGVLPVLPKLLRPTLTSQPINVSNSICLFGGAFVTNYFDAETRTRLFRRCPPASVAPRAGSEVWRCSLCIPSVDLFKLLMLGCWAGEEKPGREGGRSILSGTRMNTLYKYTPPPIFIRSLMCFNSGFAKLHGRGVNRVSSLSWLLPLFLLSLPRGNNKGLSHPFCTQQEEESQAP